MPQHPPHGGPGPGEEPVAPSWADDALAALSPFARPAETRLGTPPPPSSRESPQVGPYAVPVAMSALSMRPRTVHRQISARPAQRARQRWWATFRALTVPSNHAVRLSDALAEISAPVSTGRRIAVISAHGGAGGTTLAFCMASIAAAHRGDPVAIVDASTTHGGLLTRLAQAPIMSVSAASRRLQTDSASGRSLVGSDTLSVLSPGDSLHGATVLDAIQRHAAVTVVDAEQFDVVPAGHTVVVALENTVRGVAAAQCCLRALTGVGVPSRRVLFAVTARVIDSGVSVAWVNRELSSLDVAGIFVVPPDRHLAGAAHIHCHLLAGATYLALAELTGSAVGISTGDREAVGNEC